MLRAISSRQPLGLFNLFQKYLLFKLVMTSSTSVLIPIVSSEVIWYCFSYVYFKWNVKSEFYYSYESKIFIVPTLDLLGKERNILTFLIITVLLVHCNITTTKTLLYYINITLILNYNAESACDCYRPGADVLKLEVLAVDLMCTSRLRYKNVIIIIHYIYGLTLM